MGWDIFKETREVLIEMGGPGSGHRGHAGRKGKRGGSAPSKAGAPSLQINGKWPSQGALEDSILRGTIDYDETYTLDIGGTVYKVKTEGWWEDCLESRGLCATSSDAVEGMYKDIMVTEAGWAKADISGYVEGGQLEPDFGITYIGKKIR